MTNYRITEKGCLKTTSRDFPGNPVVKNPTYNAGNVGSIPGRGTKIPYATRQLSPCANTTGPTRPGA